MNAKEYLNQAYLLDQQINSKLEQLNNLRSMTQKVTVSYEGAAVSHTRNMASMQDIIIRMMEAEDTVSREIEKLMDIKTKIGNTIAKVKNPDYRLILEKRYLSYRSWSQIAEDMRYSERWVYVKHERALTVVSRLLEGGQAE